MAVYFSPSPSSDKKGKGTPLPIRRLLNVMNIAYWGEDNRFPQNIEQQMAYCGVGKADLDRKARMFYGNGIVPGKITGQKMMVPKFLQRWTGLNIKRIMPLSKTEQWPASGLNILQDWVWFGNCFPEVFFQKIATKITGFVHQESCDRL